MNVRHSWQGLMDGLAIGASGLCLVHCLALPAIIIALPAIGALIDVPDSAHFWGLVFAVPLSIVALASGVVQHARYTPAFFAFAGMGILILAKARFHDTAQEVAIAVSGSVIVALGHALNLRAVHDMSGKAGRRGNPP